MKTQKIIKLKSGETLPAGLPVTFIPDNARLCLVQGERAEPYKIRITSAFKSPSMRALENENDDCGCTSICGEWVELDGWDCHGSPSWLLALGMI